MIYLDKHHDDHPIKQKRYPGCLAHPVIGMVYSVVANLRQPQNTYNVLQRRCQPRPTIICTGCVLGGGGGDGAAGQVCVGVRIGGGCERHIVPI